MHNHGPSCLVGPVTRERDWWRETTNDTNSAMPAAAKRKKPKNQGRQAEQHPIRTELVKRVRREIADGVYDTPEKWEAALDHLFERMEKE